MPSPSIESDCDEQGVYVAAPGAIEVDNDLAWEHGRKCGTLGAAAEP
jgi:hypothetical protein